MNQQVISLKDLVTPGGRFVMGDLDRRQDLNYEKQPIPPEDQEFYFGVAIPKNAPGFNELWQQLHGMAVQAYANSQPVLAQIQQGINAPGFSWKIDDGDAPKIDPQSGAQTPPREYTVGCWVFHFRTKYDFGCCDETNVDIAKNQIKRGDYIDVNFAAQPNGRFDGNAGIKIYPNAVRRLGFGDAISGAVAASQAFAGRAAVPMGNQMPTGAGTPAATAPAASLPTAAPVAAPAPAAALPTAAPAPVAAQPVAQPAAAPVAAPAPVADPNAGNALPPAGAAMPAATGTMPAAQPAMATTSPTEAGVAPHPGILAGPTG